MRIVDAVNKLKSGIETGNHRDVEEAYQLLTGEELHFPDPTPCAGTCGGVDKLKEIVESNGDNGELSVVDNFSTASSEPDFTMNPKRGNRRKIRKFENKFDPGTEADEEEGYDSIDDSVEPVARDRKPHKKVDVFCQDCKQTISVDPQFAKDPYRCDFVKLNQKCPYNS